MSYEGTICPCGNRKQPNTMLCDECERVFADHPSMRDFKHHTDIEMRQHAAMTLVSLSRGRKTAGRTGTTKGA